MALIEKIQNVFPRATDIPKTLLNGIHCVQTGYLINGEIGSGRVRARRCSRPFGWRETRIRSLFSLVNIRC
jgi:hypothetical protein